MAISGSTNEGTQSSSPGSARKTVSDDIDALRSDIASLASSVSKLATETLGSTVEDAHVKTSEKLGDIEAAIRRNPTQSAMIAVGIGFLFGLIVTR